MDRGVDHFAQVVRRNVRRHADGDALRAVDQQVREPRRQHRGLLELEGVVRFEVDGVLVDAGQHFVGQQRQTTLGVSGGGRRKVGRAEVAVEVDQRLAQREGLRHAHERVVDRRVAVRVELTHDFTRDSGALHAGTVRPRTHVVHAVEDPAVDRLEAVARVGQGPRHDDRHRVVEEGAFHLLLEARCSSTPPTKSAERSTGVCVFFFDCVIVGGQIAHIGSVPLRVQEADVARVGDNEVLACFDVVAEQDAEHT